MARHPKEGLDYFPLDCDIESDEKIFFLESKHGTVAFSIIIKIWSRIFRKKGYYLIWDEREEITFSRQTAIPLNDVKMVVNDCINEGLFHQKLFQQYGVLTSKGVQKRYLGACYKRRRIQMIEALLLIPVTDYNNVIIVDLPEEITPLIPEETPLMPGKKPQSKGKESKEEKKEKEEPDSDESSQPSFEGTKLSKKFFKIISGLFPDSAVDEEEDQNWYIEKIQKNEHYSTLNHFEELDAWEDWLTKELRKKRAHQKHRFPENFKGAFHNWLKRSIEFEIKRKPPNKPKEKEKEKEKEVKCKFCGTEFQLASRYGKCTNPDCEEYFYMEGDHGKPIERHPVESEIAD